MYIWWWRPPTSNDSGGKWNKHEEKGNDEKCNHCSGHIWNGKEKYIVRITEFVFWFEKVFANLLFYLINSSWFKLWYHMMYWKLVLKTSKIFKNKTVNSTSTSWYILWRFKLPHIHSYLVILMCVPFSPVACGKSQLSSSSNHNI